KVGAFAGNVSSAHVRQALQVARPGSKVQQAARPFHVDAARFVKRMVKANRCGRMNNASHFLRQAIPRLLIQSAVWQADITREDLDPRPELLRNNLIGPLLARLARSVANEQSKRSIRLANQQLSHQLGSKKASCAGNQYQFRIFHSKIWPRSANILKADER